MSRLQTIFCGLSEGNHRSYQDKQATGNLRDPLSRLRRCEKLPAAVYQQGNAEISSEGNASRQQSDQRHIQRREGVKIEKPRLKAAKFISTAYIPVAKVQDSAGATLLADEIGVDSDSPAEDVEQQLVQQNAVPGQILGYAVVNGGTGYTSPPTLEIVGDGTNAKAVPTVVGGAITKVTVKDSSDNSIAFGSGYTRASVSISGGGGDSAEIRAIIGPTNGVGADPRDELKSGAMMFNTKPTGTENGDFVVNQQFRQVMLLKNLLIQDSSAVFTQETGLGLSKLTLTSVNDGPFVDDLVVQGATSGVKAFIDDVDSSGIFFHQSDYTGYGSFQNGETISIVEGGGSTTATVSNTIKGEFDPLSGELLYIDNRAAVERSTDQTEDIKIVIQL